MKRDIAARLERARKLRDRSIRSLQQELEEAGVPGSSYPNVHAYMKGRTQQSVEFLDAAARALRVNVEWLVFDKGPMTDEHAAESAPATAARSLWPWEHVRDGFRKGFGPGADAVLGVNGDRVSARGFLVARTARLLASSPARDALVPPDKSLGLFGAARVIGKALRSQFRSLEIDPRGPILDDVMDDFVMSACLALRQLFDHSTQEASDA